MQKLKQLADELRSEVIFDVSGTGGHLGSNLGVVELTIALHYVFNAPKDKILWDVGHQVWCFMLFGVVGTSITFHGVTLGLNYIILYEFCSLILIRYSLVEGIRCIP